jgi:hypothetical protein
MPWSIEKVCCFKKVSAQKLDQVLSSSLSKLLMQVAQLGDQMLLEKRPMN